MSFQDFFPQPTDEQLEEIRNEAERVRMRSEEITARVRRLLAEELTYEQLEAFQALMGHISNSSHPAVLANWYEGIAYGVMSIRDIVLGEGEVKLDER